MRRIDTHAILRWPLAAVAAVAIAFAAGAPDAAADDDFDLFDGGIRIDGPLGTFGVGTDVELGNDWWGVRRYDYDTDYHPSYYDWDPYRRTWVPTYADANDGHWVTGPYYVYDSNDNAWVRRTGRHWRYRTTYDYDDANVTSRGPTSQDPTSWDPTVVERYGNENVLRGTIDDWRRVRLRGSDQDTTLVKIRLDDGRSQIVDIGSRRTLRQMDLERGDHVTVRGETKQMGGRTVLQATSMRVDGESMLDRERSARRHLGDSVTIRGAVDRVTTVRVGPERHSFARISMEDGRDVLVDLGPGANLEDLNVSRGTPIVLAGHETTVQGRDVVLARKLRVDTRSRSGVETQPASQRYDDARVIRGQIEDWHRVRMRLGGSEHAQHLLVKLRLRDGRSTVIDLGTGVDMRQLRLERGDRIVVQGHEERVNNRSIFVAQRMRAGDQTIHVQGQGR